MALPAFGFPWARGGPPGCCPSFPAYMPKCLLPHLCNPSFCSALALARTATAAALRMAPRIGCRTLSPVPRSAQSSRQAVLCSQSWAVHVWVLAPSLPVCAAASARETRILTCLQGNDIAFLPNDGMQWQSLVCCTHPALARRCRRRRQAAASPSAPLRMAPPTSSCPWRRCKPRCTDCWASAAAPMAAQVLPAAARALICQLRRWLQRRTRRGAQALVAAPMPAAAASGSGTGATQPGPQRVQQRAAQAAATGCLAKAEARSPQQAARAAAGHPPCRRRSAAGGGPSRSIQSRLRRSSFTCWPGSSGPLSCAPAGGQALLGCAPARLGGPKGCWRNACRSPGKDCGPTDEHKVLTCCWGPAYSACPGPAAGPLMSAASAGPWSARTAMAPRS